jgi:transposase
VDHAYGLSPALSSGDVWNSVFRRFSRWSIKGVWWRIFEAMSDDPDFEYLIVDSTIVRAHQHAAGAKKGGLKIKHSAARAGAEYQDLAV